jgi:peptidoglycan DL-endopeptidase CwlO
MLVSAPGLLDVTQSRSTVVPAGVSLVCLALALLGLPLLMASAALSAGAQAPAQTSACVSAAQVSGLSDTAGANARIVVGVAVVRGGRNAAFIALMVGLAESGLRQLGNPNDPSADGLANDGYGFDHDSIGIFQQRPSWGTAAQRMDPVSSTNLFLDRLLALPNWSVGPPWLVAQSVQVSAFDGFPRPANGFSSDVGGNYRAELPQAKRILDALAPTSSTKPCPKNQESRSFATDSASAAGSSTRAPTVPRQTAAPRTRKAMHS